MAELKPCPFCGTPYPYITFERGYIDDSAVVFCNACKVSVKLEDNDQEGFNYETKRKAIEAWNRRIPYIPEIEGFDPEHLTDEDKKDITDALNFLMDKIKEEL